MKKIYNCPIVETVELHSSYMICSGGSPDKSIDDGGGGSMFGGGGGGGAPQRKPF